MEFDFDFDFNYAQAAKATGALTLQKVLDMQEAGVEVESFVSEEMRMQMYSKEVRLFLLLHSSPALHPSPSKTESAE